MSLSQTPLSNPAPVLLNEEALHQLEIALNEPFPPHVTQARAALRRDLPGLLRTHAGKWIAYNGSTQIDTGSGKTELFQQCLRAGFERGQFVVLRIENEHENQADVPLDV
jgi:hypothetical protein